MSLLIRGVVDKGEILPLDDIIASELDLDLLSSNELQSCLPLEQIHCPAYTFILLLTTNTPQDNSFRVPT